MATCLQYNRISESAHVIISSTYCEFVPAVSGIIVIKRPYVPKAEEEGGNDTHHVEREVLAVQVPSPQKTPKERHIEYAQCGTDAIAQTDRHRLNSSLFVVLFILR